jgi:hypothetical protein
VRFTARGREPAGMIFVSSFLYVFRIEVRKRRRYGREPVYKDSA